VATFDSNILAKRVIDALRMMYQGAIEQVRDVSPSLPTNARSRAATVILAGETTYQITLSTSGRGGIALAQAMFECAGGEVTVSMIDDAMCELANMTAGQVKGLIAQTHRVSQLGVVRGDQLDAGAKIVSGTCLRLAGGNAEVSVLVASIVDVSAEVVAAPSLGETSRAPQEANRAITDERGAAAVGQTEIADRLSSVSDTPLDGGIRFEQSTSNEQQLSIETTASIEPDSLTEVSNGSHQEAAQEIGVHVCEPTSSESATVLAIVAPRDPGEGAISAKVGPVTEENGAAVVLSHTALSTVEAAMQIDGPASADAALAAMTGDKQAPVASLQLLSAPADPADNEAIAVAETGSPSDQLQTGVVSEATDCPAPVVECMAETLPAIESAGPQMRASAAEAIPEMYLTVSTADTVTQDQYLSIDTTEAVDQPMSIRSTQRKQRPAREDDRFRVMIAQGNEATLKVIRRAVLARNMRLVAIARDGDEAVSEALRAKPDLLCLDLNLSKQDGLQALARIRRQLPMLTVAIICAAATMPEVRRAIELQVVSIVVSPLTHSRLTTELARIAPSTLLGGDPLQARSDIVSSPLSADQVRYLQ
jgi:CheY-like chemotaxis protein